MTTRLLKSSENINGLPIGFQEVEYLQSTGTQYIDTGYIASNTSGFSVDIMPLQATDKYFIGSRPRTSTNDRWLAGSITGPQVYIGWNTNTYASWELNKVHTVQNNFMNSRTKVLDGTVVAQISETLSSQGTRTTYLFSANDATAVSMDTCRIYKVQITEGSTLARDFIPALNPAGRPCMYDLVGKKAYYNLGSGEFTYGREIHYVEYLENVSNQASLNYIPTTYTPTTNTSLEAKVRYTGGASGATWAIGAATWWGIHYQGSGPKIGITNSSTGQYQVYAPYTAGNDITLKLDGSNVYADGTLVGSLTKQNASSTLTLFRYSTSANLSWVGRIYYLDIWDNNGYVYKFRPAIDENGVCFMFDKVTHTCYLNAGTGTFNYGKKLYSSKVRLYKDSEANKLPAGFKRVEYLESTGTQYIDTGVKGNLNSKAEIIYKYPSTSSSTGSGRVFGSRTSSASNGFGIGTASGSIIANEGVGAYFSNANIGTGTVTKVTTNTWYQTILSKDGAYFNGTKEEFINGSVTDFTTPNNLKLFGFDNNGTMGYGLVQISKCKIWDNNILVRDFVPALDTTNTPCMYDTVTQTAFYNQGNGQFTHGPVIPNKVRLPQSTEIRLPKGYTEVEYIQGSGTQYINTEYKPIPATTKFELMFSPDTVAGNSFLFGCRPDTGIGAFTCTTYFATGSVRQDWAGLNTYFPAITANNKYLYSAYNNTITFNGETETGTITRSTERLNLNFLLFTVNTNGTADDRRFIGKVYYSKLWDNGNLVRYFIPCLDPNGRPCLWDVVTKKPFYNAGTGEFTYGRSIQQVSYLESSGTQYIDTGWHPSSNNLQVKFKAKSIGSPSATAICGAEKKEVTPRWVFILYGQSGNPTKTYPLTGDWNNTSSDTAFTFTSGTTLEIDWTTSATETTITDKITNTAYTQTFGSSMNYPNNTITLKLFQNTDTQKSSIQMNYYQIWDNGTLVRDYIPAIDSNNVGFMFDRVTHTIFDNAGTDPFTYGSPVPNKIRN